MLRLIKIELTKILCGKSIWISLCCALAIITGFAILLNMDSAFDEGNEEQVALEENYENSNSWQEQLEAQKELNQSMLGIYSQEEIDMKNQILQYEIDENLEPYEHNTAWDFISYTFQILNVVLIIIAIWLTTEIILLDYTNKTYKLTYTKGYARWKIYLSKFITSILAILLVALAMMLMSCIIGGIAFGFGGIFSKTAICIYGKIFSISLVGEALLYTALAILKTIIISSVAFLIAELSKNQILTVIFTIACSLWGKMIFSKLIENGMTVGKYSLFMQYDFVSVIDSPSIKSSNLMLSSAVVIIHLLAFLMIGIWFNKREDM